MQRFPGFPQASDSDRMSTLSHKVFRDLEGIQGRALQKLIAANPECQTVIKGRIQSDSPYLAIVSAGTIQWHRILFQVHVVKNFETRELGKHIARICNGDRPLKIGMNRNGMRAKNGDPYAGDRSAESRMMHNFAALIDEFYFLLGVSRLQKDINLRQHIKCDRIRKNLRFILLALEMRLRLKG